MNFCSVYQMLGNVSSTFFGIFELMGGSTVDMDMAVFSGSGILMLCKICLVMLFLICGIRAFIMCIRKQGNLRCGLLISIAVWNYFVLNITNVRAGSATYEYRYHLIGMIPLVCVTVIVLLNEFYKMNKMQQKWLFIIIFSVLIGFSGMCFKKLYMRGEQNADLKEFVEYCKKTDAEVIYLYYGSNDSDICRLLDSEHLYLHINENGYTWVYDYYDKYVDAPMQTENIIVAVNDMENPKGDSFMMQGLQLVRFYMIGNRSLYHIYVPES